MHQAFAGVALILHAGDVGDDAVLDELAIIAPVHAVFGNTDDHHNPRLSAAIDIVVEGLRIHVSHGHELGAPTPEKLLARYAADVIVYGHTHIPLVTSAGGRLVVNPGAAGPKRFEIAPSVGVLKISNGTAEVLIVDLS